MQLPTQLLLATLGVVLLASHVHPLRCWVCSSSSDARCRDPFNSTRLADADCERHRATGFNDYVYCQKMVTSINGGENKVLRKCVFSRTPLENGCFDMPQNTEYIRVEHCSTCDTDDCNGAPVPIASTATVVATVAALATSWMATRLIH